MWTSTIMNLEDYIELVACYKKVALTGPPKSGKTILANQIKDRSIIHADDYRTDLAPGIEAVKLNMFLIEGVQVPRILSKGLDVQIVICLNKSLESLDAYQRDTAKSVHSILTEWSRSSIGEDTPIVYLNQPIAVPSVV